MNTKKTPFLTPLSLTTLAAASAFVALVAGCNSDGIFVTGDYPGASAGLETSSGEDSDSDIADTDPTGDDATGGDENPSTTTGGNEDTTSTGADSESTSTTTGGETSGSDSDSESSSTGDPCTPVTCQNLTKQAAEYGFYDGVYPPNGVDLCEFKGYDEGTLLNWPQAQTISLMSLRGGVYDQGIKHGLLTDFDPQTLPLINYADARSLQTLELMGVIGEIPDNWKEPVACLEDLDTMEKLVDYGPYEIPTQGFSFYHTPGDEYQVVYRHAVPSLNGFMANLFSIEVEWVEWVPPEECTLTLMRADGDKPSLSLSLKKGVNLLEVPGDGYFPAGLNFLELSCVIDGGDIGSEFSLWGDLLHDGVTELLHHKYSAPAEQTVGY